MAKKTPKRLNMNQWKAVVRATTRAYADSYAMMIDDAMVGFVEKGAKYGLLDCWDGAVFSLCYQLAKRFVYEPTAEEVERLNEMWDLDHAA